MVRTKSAFASQLLVADPARAGRVVLGDQAVEIGLDLGLVELGVRQIEIQAALLRADLAAGHVAFDDGAEQVHAGVHAHVAVAPLPIDLGGDLVAG